MVTIVTSPVNMLPDNFIKPRYEISVLEDITDGNMLDRNNLKLKTYLI